MIAWLLIAMTSLGAAEVARDGNVCMCMTGPESRGPSRGLSDSKVIFVGTALEVNRPVASEEEVSQQVRFLIEATWLGPAADTVTINVYEDAPCANYVAGSRYLVLADLPRAESRPIETSPCHFAWGLTYPQTKKFLTELGPPRRRFPMAGSRAIDQGTTSIGAPVPQQGALVYVGIGISPVSEVAAVTVADQLWSRTETGVPAFKLTEGLYRLRIDWRDGTASTHTYISVRCEEGTPAAGCYAFRYMAGHREGFRLRR